MTFVQAVQTRRLHFHMRPTFTVRVLHDKGYPWVKVGFTPASADPAESGEMRTWQWVYI